MPKFDHRFDSQIQRKEDIRFMDTDQGRQDAEDFAIAQYSAYCVPQSVVRLADGMIQVMEMDFVKNLPGTVEQLFYVDSLPND